MSAIMDAFLQSRIFRVLLVVILVALLVIAIGLQLEPRHAAVSAADTRFESSGSIRESSVPAASALDRPLEIPDQPSLIDGF